MIGTSELMGWIQLGGPRIYGDVWPVVWNQEQRRCSQVDVSMNSGWGPDHMQDMAVWAVLDMKAGDMQGTREPCGNL